MLRPKGAAASSVVNVLRWQVRLALPVIVLCSIISSPHEVAGLSAFFGALIGIVPAWAYAKIAYREPRQAPRKLLAAHFLAEAAKFCVTAVLFAVVFWVFKDVKPLALFAGFLATIQRRSGLSGWMW